jgi:hypothetical protein
MPGPPVSKSRYQRVKKARTAFKKKRKGAKTQKKSQEYHKKARKRMESAKPFWLQEGSIKKKVLQAFGLPPIKKPRKRGGGQGG